MPERHRIRGLKTAFVAAVFTLVFAGCSDSNKGTPFDPGPLPDPAPEITAHPRDTSVVAGGTATFSITATGATSYRWVDSLGDTLPGDTTATLTLTAIPLSQNGATFKCVARNENGATSSRFAVLTVTPAPAPLNPMITAQPVSSSLVPGGSTTLAVTATGPGLRYQWYRGSPERPLLFGTTATLVVTRTPSPGVAEEYYCVVSNPHGSVTSDTVTVRADASRRFLLDTGAVLFAERCASCHGSTGRGVAGIVPPVANADFILQNRTRGIDIVLAGASDSLRVNGLWYRAVMPAYTDSLSDVQVAAVLTWIRAGLNDSTVTSCDAGQRDGDNFAVCQKSPRTPQSLASDSVSYQEVFEARSVLFPL